MDFYNKLLMLIVLLPAIGAIIGLLIGLNDEKKRDVFNIILTGAHFLIVCFMFKPLTSHGSFEIYIPKIMGVGFDIKLDMLRYIFVWITSLIWFLATVYSSQYLINYINRNRYYAFFMLTFSATLGVFMSENIINLFTFFEIMSFTSYVLIIHDQDKYAHDAGVSYLGMAIAGSFILLMGIFLAYDYTGAITLTQLRSKFQLLGNEKYFISLLILVGFGVKASVFPLHVWLPKAHPAAPSPASAVLSGILIKTGIFGIMMTSLYILQGDLKISYLLTTLGLINMFLGGFLALFQRNIKTVFAYSSMSQAGYIILGIGVAGMLKMHAGNALYGVLLHVINHAVFKVLLFFIAGLMYMDLHELAINRIKGYGKHTKVLKIIFLIAMLAITGVPGFSGYTGKTVIHHALSEAAKLHGGVYFSIAEVVFTLASAFTVAYMVKIFITVFIKDNDKFPEPDEKEKKRSPVYHMSPRAVIPMLILSLLIIFVGVFPEKLYPIISAAIGNLGYGDYSEIHLFDTGSILSSIVTILIGLAIYVLFVNKFLMKSYKGEKIYVNPSVNWFNIERDLYKPFFKWIYRLLSKIFEIVDKFVLTTVTNMGHFLSTVLLKEVNMRFYYDYRQEESEKSVIPMTVKELAYNIRCRFNSMDYSLFIFAIILAVTLVYIIVSYK